MEFSRKCMRRVTFAVVDVALQFVLGMSWLRSSNAHVEFSSGRIQLRDKSGLVEATITADHSPQHCDLHMATLHPMQAFEQLQHSNAVFACSAKQANHLFNQINCTAIYAMQRATA